MESDLSERLPEVMIHRCVPNREASLGLFVLLAPEMLIPLTSDPLMMQLSVLSILGGVRSGAALLPFVFLLL